MKKSPLSSHSADKGQLPPATAVCKSPNIRDLPRPTTAGSGAGKTQRGVKRTFAHRRAPEGSNGWETEDGTEWDRDWEGGGEGWSRSGTSRGEMREERREGRVTSAFVREDVM